MDARSNTFEAWLSGAVQKTYKHYYLQLSDNEKEVYDLFLNAFIHFEKEIKIKPFDIKRVSDIYHKCKKDNPLIFYLDTFVMYSSVSSNRIEISYKYTLEEAKAIFVLIKKASDSICIKTKKNRDFAKVVEVHNYIMKNVEYVKDETLPIREGHSLFVYNKAVCAGIAKSAKILLDAIGIKCLYISGYSHKFNEVVDYSAPGHAWNIVWVDNIPFHMDFTFDHGLMDGRKDIRYDYFMLSDKQIGYDHEFEPVGVEANSVNDWYRMSRKYYDNKDELVKFIKQQIELDFKRIHFKIGYSDDPDKAFEEIKEYVFDTIHKYKKGYSATYYINKEQMVMNIFFNNTK